MLASYLRGKIRVYHLENSFPEIRKRNPKVKGRYGDAVGLPSHIH